MTSSASIRPPKPTGRRGNVTMRMDDILKAALQREAGAYDRSLSEEVEARLRRSLDDEQRIRESLEFADRTTAFMQLISRAVRETAQIATDPELGGDWLDQRPAFDAVRCAVERVFNAVEPLPSAADDPSLTEMRIGDHVVADLLNRLLAALINPAVAARNLGPWAAPIAEKLGIELIGRIRSVERAPDKVITAGAKP
jgi:hypothetical protein